MHNRPFIFCKASWLSARSRARRTKRSLGAFLLRPDESQSELDTLAGDWLFIPRHFATVSAKETSFGMEFQFSLHRNVVVSRSRGLLLVFRAPHLRKAKRDMVQQIWLANSLFLSSRFLEPAT